MWSWLASFLGGPVINGLISAYKAKLTAENTTDKIAADLAGRELAVHALEIQAQNQIRIAEIGKWYEPDKLMGYAVAFIVIKILVWDISLGLGSTPEPKGWIATVTNLVVVSYFGKRGIENVATIAGRIFKR